MKGFTLIELMIVLVIISILVGVSASHIEKPDENKTNQHEGPQEQKDNPFVID